MGRGIAAVIGATAGLNASFAQPSAVADPPVDRIIVTARRVSEDALRIPVSVSSFQGDALETLSAPDVTALSGAASVPAASARSVVLALVSADAAGLACAMSGKVAGLSCAYARESDRARTPADATTDAALLQPVSTRSARMAPSLRRPVL